MAPKLILTRNSVEQRHVQDWLRSVDGTKWTSFGGLDGFVWEQLRDDDPEEEGDVEIKQVSGDDTLILDTTIRYVNVYDVDRCYGGPEEGGWWYDSREPLASVIVGSNAEQDTVTAALVEFYGVDDADLKALGNYHSQGARIVRIEAHPAEATPVPHYE